MAENSLSLAQTSSSAKSKVFQRTRSTSKRFNAHFEHVPSDENDLAISFINNQNLGWKADTCKLQKHHAEYGSHCAALELAQLSKNETVAAKVNTTANATKQNVSSASVKAEVKQVEKPKPVFGDKSAEFKKVLDKVQNYAKKYKTADDIPDTEIPESLNFANIDGFDFTGPIRDQGACGSCYTVSFT